MGAKMVEFNGWDMPVEYPTSGGIIAEHMAVRTGVGIFDVSHMGDIRLSGPGALAAVQHISMNDAARLAVGQAQYSALLYPQGTLVEDGIEIYIPADEATSARVWNEILKTGKDLGILPCGLGARNTLRLEAKLPLYEHEISDTINVWEAGLDRFCKMEKPEFIGRAALEKARTEGLNRVLTGIEMIDRGIARDGYKVQDETGREIGYVTSGSPAPFLKKNIALAYVPPAFSEIGRELKVDIRGQGVTARVVPTPFYKRQKKT